MSTEPIKVKYWSAYLKKHPDFTGCLINKNNNNTAWFKNGVYHRENGPALEYTEGSKAWFKNGKLHRENGPAVEYSDGDKRWYLNGEELSEQQHHLKVRHIKLKLLDTIQHSL